MAEKNQILKMLEEFVDKISKDFDNVKPLKAIADRFGLKTGQIVAGSFILIFTLVILGACSHIITTAVGFLYPAYMSFKAIQSKDDKDDQQWLTYWIVFGFLIVFDMPISFVLSFIPLYQVFKLLFLIYLFYPKTRGAEKIYNSFLKDILIKYESFIDSKLQLIEDTVNKTKTKLAE